MICPICGNERFVKNGFHHDKQRYKCKDCGYQYTKENSRRPQYDIKMAVSLYSVGLSFRTIAKMFGTSPNTIYLWVKSFAELNYDKPMPKGKIEVELDEMCHFINEKKQNCGFGKHMTEQINNFLTGNLATEVRKLSKGSTRD